MQIQFKLTTCPITFQGGAGYNTSGQYQETYTDYRQHYDRNQHPSDYTDYTEQWNETFTDLGVKDYFDNIYSDASYAIDLIRKHNDWSEFKTFIYNHKVFFASIIIPLAATLRFPGLAIGALRGIMVFFVYYFQFLPRYQQRRIARWIFKSLRDQAKGRTRGQRRGGNRGRREDAETRRKRYTKYRSRRF